MNHRIDRPYNDIAKLLELRGGPALPASVSDVLVPVKSLDTTFPYLDLLFKSVAGGAGVNDIELPATPAGQLEYPIAIEISHNDAAARPLHFGIRWPRAGTTTSVALVGMQSYSQNFPAALPNGSRLALPADARIYGFGIGVIGNIVLKMCYVSVRLGEVVPP